MDEAQSPVHSYTNLTITRAKAGGGHETACMVLAEIRITGEVFAAEGATFEAAKAEADAQVAAWMAAA